MVVDDEKIYLSVDYGDEYVQPLLVAALKARLPPELLVFVNGADETPPPHVKLLQWCQYENLDFERLLEHPETSLANSYVIRKALIRKHYLSTTVSHWLTKHPDSMLQKHVKPAVAFEVDYADFLDDALVEAFELKESWARNEQLQPTDEREWWILKPGMSDRGQGVRLFSSEQELTEIFEAWDPPSDEDDDNDDNESVRSGDERMGSPPAEHADDQANGVITSQLRHFIAQPYIHPPLLLPEPHCSAGRKFHIRTYVLATGALQVYVYRPMLALFAGPKYAGPSASHSPNDELPSHLTNTCLQTGERDGSVHAFWSLPSHLPGFPNSAADTADWREYVFDQICAITGATFEAAARAMGIHFQPLPNAFEIFGLDFLVDEAGTTWLLEVNAFPDFAQTGAELQGLIRGLFEDVITTAVAPFFGCGRATRSNSPAGALVPVLDVDLGRR